MAKATRLVSQISRSLAPWSPSTFAQVRQFAARAVLCLLGRSRSPQHAFFTAFGRSFRIDGVPVRLVRDDDRFEDALIHLGGMGIVNGVAIELADNQRFAELERLMPLTQALLDAIGNAQFDQLAAALGCPVAPAFL